MSCDGDNEYILITKKCQQLILFFLIFFSEFFTFLCILLYCMKIDFFNSFLFCLFCFVFLFCFFYFYISFFFITVYGSSETGGIETRRPARGYGGARGGCAGAGYGAER